MSSVEIITSRQNPRVKEAARLRDSRHRQRDRRFLIDGVREIARAIDSRIACRRAFLCEELLQSSAARDAARALRDSGAEILAVSRDVYEKIAFGDRHEGIVVVAEAPERPLANLQLPPEPLLAVIEGVEKPGNVGAIFRSADAAGIDAVIVADCGTDLFNPNTIRASLGTVFRPNIACGTSAEVIRWLKERNVAIFAARPDAELLYTEADLRRAAAIVLGSEAAGLSAAWLDAAIRPIRLPMHGIADSLNVSTTAAILFYEALRQRAN